MSTISKLNQFQAGKKSVYKHFKMSKKLGGGAMYSLYPLREPAASTIAL